MARWGRWNTRKIPNALSAAAKNDRFADLHKPARTQFSFHRKRLTREPPLHRANTKFIVPTGLALILSPLFVCKTLYFVELGKKIFREVDPFPLAPTDEAQCTQNDAHRSPNTPRAR
jgi:hypothetical protein